MNDDTDPTQEHRDDNIEIEEEAASTYPMTSPSGLPRESELVQALLPGVKACRALLADTQVEDRIFVHYMALAAAMAALKALKSSPETGKPAEDQAR